MDDGILAVRTECRSHNQNTAYTLKWQRFCGEWLWLIANICDTMGERENNTDGISHIGEWVSGLKLAWWLKSKQKAKYGLSGFQTICTHIKAIYCQANALIVKFGLIYQLFRQQQSKSKEKDPFAATMDCLKSKQIVFSSTNSQRNSFYYYLNISYELTSFLIS